MGILHLINSLEFGGAETFLVRLSKAQVRAGNSVCILLLGGGDMRLISDAMAGGVKIKPNANSSVYSPAAVSRLYGILKDEHFDVVHSHLFPAQYVAAMAAMCLPAVGRPTLVTTEHSTHNRRREKALLRFLDGRIYGRYESIACISPAVMHSLTTAQPSIASKCLVIENGLDFPEIDVSRRGDLERLTGLRRPIVLCVGRLQHEKGHDVLIRSLVHLPEISLAIVGIGTKGEELQHLAKVLGIRERVRFLGTRTDVYALMKDCDVYVQPSRWEGFGMAALEAIANGAKTVCSDVPGLRDVVQGSGWLVPPEDSEALARGIRLALLAEPRDGESAIRQRYSIERAVELYQSLYSLGTATRPRV